MSMQVCQYMTLQQSQSLTKPGGFVPSGILIACNCIRTFVTSAAKHKAFVIARCLSGFSQLMQGNSDSATHP